MRRDPASLVAFFCEVSAFFAGVFFLPFVTTATLQHTCNTLQHTATHCNTLQQTMTHCAATLRVFQCFVAESWPVSQVLLCCTELQHVAIRCNTLQYTEHTVIHCTAIFAYFVGSCTAPQHAATRYDTAIICDTLQDIATHCNTLQDTAAHCNTLQHTATHCSTLQNTAAHLQPIATLTIFTTSAYQPLSTCRLHVCVCECVYVCESACA